MHRTTRRWVTGAAALSAGVLMIGPVTAFAQSDDPSGSTTTTAPSTPSDTPDAPDILCDNLVRIFSSEGVEYTGTVPISCPASSVMATHRSGSSSGGGETLRVSM